MGLYNIEISHNTCASNEFQCNEEKGIESKNQSTRVESKIARREIGEVLYNVVMFLFLSILYQLAFFYYGLIGGIGEWSGFIPG